MEKYSFLTEIKVNTQTLLKSAYKSSGIKDPEVLNKVVQDLRFMSPKQRQAILPRMNEISSKLKKLVNSSQKKIDSITNEISALKLQIDACRNIEKKSELLTRVDQLEAIRDRFLAKLNAASNAHRMYLSGQNPARVVMQGTTDTWVEDSLRGFDPSVAKRIL